MSASIKEIGLWISKGDHDLGTAKITYLYIPEYLDTVTFHCQQSVEKYLKAYLIFLDIPFKFTHDLVYLLDLMVQKDPDFHNYYEIVSELQGYAIEVRYPNETIFLSKEKVETALMIARNVRELVTLKMKVKIDYNDIIDK